MQNRMGNRAATHTAAVKLSKSKMREKKNEKKEKEETCSGLVLHSNLSPTKASVGEAEEDSEECTGVSERGCGSVSGGAKVSPYGALGFRQIKCCLLGTMVNYTQMNC